jgi:Carboxypeptidase regulatory-like domain/PDZ domain
MPDRRWLLALGAAVALVALPLLAWWFLPARPAPRPRAPRADVPALRRTEPLPEAQDGLRLVLGSVVDPDGEPVMAAIISVGRNRAISNNDGRFKLEGVSLEAVRIVARAQGFEEMTLDLDAGQSGDREQIDLVLEVARGAEGVVLDADGEPVERAIITCVDHRDDPTLGAHSDPEGRFTLPSKAVGCEAVARHRDHGDSDHRTLRAGEGNSLRLTAPASIAGRVLDERGEVIEGCMVAIENFVAVDAANVAGKRGAQVQVDDVRGEFLFEKLQAGSYVLSASAPGRPPARSDRVDVATGEQVRAVRIELPRGAIMVGRVVDAESGDPIPGARVVLDGLTTTRVSRIPAATADAEGRYELDGAPAGPFSVSVSAKGFHRKVEAGIETRGAPRLERDFELSSAGDGKAVTEYSGIGARLANAPTGLMIGQVVKGGPSEAAGLLAKDRIVMVDGRDTSDMTTAQAVQLLRGPTGTRVSITVERVGTGRLDFVVTRDTFTQ